MINADMRVDSIDAASELVLGPTPAGCVLCSLSNTPHIKTLKATQQYNMSISRHQQLPGGAYRLSKGKFWLQLLQQQTHSENEHIVCIYSFRALAGP